MAAQELDDIWQCSLPACSAPPRGYRQRGAGASGQRDRRAAHTAAYGYRLRTDCLRDVFYEGGALAQLLMRYSSALFAQMAQNVVGGRHCTIE